jgi:hypothetical protein
MSKLELVQRWLAVVVLTGALAACSGEATAPTATPALQVAGTISPKPIGVRPPCDNAYSGRVCPLLP